MPLLLPSGAGQQLFMVSKLYNSVVWMGDGTQCWFSLWHVTAVWSLGSCQLCLIHVRDCKCSRWLWAARGSYFPFTLNKKFILVAGWGLGFGNEMFAFILYEATPGSGLYRVSSVLALLLVLVSLKYSFYWLSWLSFLEGPFVRGI